MTHANARIVGALSARLGLDPGATVAEVRAALEREIQAEDDPDLRLWRAELDHNYSREGMRGYLEAEAQISQGVSGAGAQDLDRVARLTVRGRRIARAISWGSGLGIATIAVLAVTWVPGVPSGNPAPFLDEWLKTREWERFVRAASGREERGGIFDPGPIASNTPLETGPESRREREAELQRFANGLGVQTANAHRAEPEHGRIASLDPGAVAKRSESQRSSVARAIERAHRPTQEEVERSAASAGWLPAIYACDGEISCELPRPLESGPLRAEVEVLGQAAVQVGIGQDCETAEQAVLALSERGLRRSEAPLVARWLTFVGACWLARDAYARAERAARQAICVADLSNVGDAFEVLFWSAYKRAVGGSRGSSGAFIDRPSARRAQEIGECLHEGTIRLGERFPDVKFGGLIAKYFLSAGAYIYTASEVFDADALERAERAFLEGERRLREHIAQCPSADARSVHENELFSGMSDHLEVMVLRKALPTVFEPAFQRALDSPGISSSSLRTLRALRVIWAMRRGDYAEAESQLRVLEQQYRADEHENWDWSTLRRFLKREMTTSEPTLAEVDERALLLTTAFEGRPDEAGAAVLRGVRSWVAAQGSRNGQAH